MEEGGRERRGGGGDSVGLLGGGIGGGCCAFFIFSFKRWCQEFGIYNVVTSSRLIEVVSCFYYRGFVFYFIL